MHPPPALKVSSGEDKERDYCTKKYTSTNTPYSGSTHDAQVATTRWGPASPFVWVFTVSSELVSRLHPPNGWLPQSPTVAVNSSSQDSALSSQLKAWGSLQFLQKKQAWSLHRTCRDLTLCYGFNFISLHHWLRPN